LCANPGCCNAAGNFCNQPHFSYIYDEAGQRLAKVAADGSIVSAFSAAGVFGTSGWTEPFQSQGAVLGLVDKGGLTPFDADVRGTMLAAAGQSVERPSPFGHRRAQPAVATASAFIGQPFEPSLGAMRLGVRDYDPEFGIFMQPDPLFLFHPEACVNDPMSCSLYTYGHNDPVNHVDPSGLADETVSIGTGGGDAGGGAPASPPLQYCFILCFDSPSSTQSPDAGGTPYRPMPAPPPRTLADFSNVLGGSYAGPGSLNDGRGNTMFAGPPGAGAGASWSSSASSGGNIFYRWVTGQGDRMLYYGPNSSEAAEMRSNEAYQLRMKTYITDVHNSPSGEPFQRIIGAPGQGYSTLMSHPLSGVVGTFGMVITPAGGRSVDVALWNRTGLSSFLRDFFPGGPGRWEFPGIKPRYTPDMMSDFGAYLPMTDLYQVWGPWQEQVP